MKKLSFVILAMMLSVSVMAQQKIQLRSADRAECLSSDMTSLQASFSFSSIEAEDYPSDRGTFSWLSLANTVIGGNEGDPQIPVVNELIAVPFGASPRIEITSFSSTDYRLDDYGIHTLVPRQPSLRKDQRPEDVPFLMNEAAYQTRGFRSTPMAVVSVVGTMRGVQLGKMTIEPVSYDPVNNTLRVFNDIEVTVHFDGADARATEQMLVDTYSPYFNGIYDMLFNGRSVRDAYSAHPDLYTTPVKMLVVTTSTFTSSTAFQNWLNWKKQKGIDVDVQTVTSSTSSSNVRSLIQSRYNANHPTFLVIVGDETAVKYYTTWTDNSLNYSPYISDNAYASIDSDVYHDMFMSRMSVANTTQLGYLVDKILMYEQYTMPDPSYLNNVLLIAGADNTWAPKVGRPTINYAADNYFNTAHGFSNVYKYVTSSYTGCYNYLSSGVGFANYTAHGDIQEWYSPNFTNSNVNSLTNTNKYFWAMGNCCLTANWGNSSYSPCFGEAMIRAQNKGAFGYIGSIPESYWYEDYYFGVGATSVMSQTPTMSQTTTGVYDFMFDDTKMNTLNSVPFAGNVAVTYAHANSYTSSVSDEYYWRGYQCLGDGSVMPYHVAPAANTVSHASQLQIGATSFTVSAVAGSYVAITVNNEIIGVAEVPSNGTVNVPITAQTATGTAKIVVTRQQRQPYITTIPIQGGTQYNIGASANPTEGGSVNGAGQYYEGTECTLTATANTGYTFVNWTKNGTQVSNNASYTFTVNSSANYVANFSLNSYQVTATANPTAGGTITGAGPYNHGATCTLTATANTGYTFVNWTKDGNEVSTQATINFTVTEAASYIANFELNSYELVVMTVPVAGGNVAISGNSDAESLYYDFENGTQGWTVLQGTNGDSPNSWMHNTDYNGNDYSTGYGHNSNGFMLSESFVFANPSDEGTPVEPDNYLVSPRVQLGGSITFWATNADDQDGAEHFAVAVSTKGNTNVNDFTQVQEWTLGAKAVRTGNTRNIYDHVWNEYTVSLSAFSGLGYVAIHHFDCYEQWMLCVDDITIVEGNNGISTATFSHGATCTLTATPNDGYDFVSWTENGQIVSTDAVYSFVVTGERELVANFEETIPSSSLNLELAEGWTWWAPNVDITLEAFEAALGSNGVNIISQDGAVATYSSNGWGGDLTAIEVGKMYMVQTSAACTITVSGYIVDPTEYPVTIEPGVNWMGFIGIEEMSINEALMNFTPSNLDNIKTQTGNATYYQGRGWRGSATNLVPGEGFIYTSKASTPQTFNYPAE